jgi:hypothetical protein
MNEVRAKNGRRRRFSFLLLLLLLATFSTAGVAFAGLPAGNLSGLEVQGNPGAQGTPMATATCSPLGVWSIRPETEPAPAYLYGVDAVSSNDAWAVGYYQAQHWDGATWARVSLPSPGSGFNGLYGVAAIALNDVWAVGMFYNNGGQYQTLTEHWNGSSWSVVPSPNQGTTGSELHAVTAISSNDVWAVGHYGCCNLTNTLIEHWDGTQWSIVPSPNRGLYENLLLGVAAISANDLWAVGLTRDSTSPNDPTLTLTMHWDGSTWTIVPSPNQGNYSDLNAVAAISSNDVWAVGLGLTMHWDGVAWSTVPSPGGYLNSVAAISSNDVWAVGYGAPGPPIDHPWSIHWNGSAWSVVPVADPGGLINELHGVAAVSGSDIWAVGWSTYGTRPGDSLIEHYSVLVCATPMASPTAGVSNTPTRTTTQAPPTFTSTSTIIAPSNTVPVPSHTVLPPTHTAPVPSNTALAATPTSTVTTTCTITFTDVPSGSTFYQYIMCLACRGIVSGYSDGTFRPNNEVTRGQLSKIVSGAAAFTEDPNPQIFADVPPTHTFYQWINRLTRRGHMTGYQCGGPGEPCINNMPYFRPFANATRGQTSKIVSNAVGFTEPASGQTFEDVPPTHTFYREIQRLASRGVMGGYPCGGPGEPCVGPANRPYVRPNNSITRGQVSKIVANTFFPNCAGPDR